MPDELSNYEIGEEIGAGSFGRVCVCTDRRTGKRRAVKVLPLEDDDEDIEDVRSEVATLAHCSHANVMRNYAVFFHDHCVYIVMEYLGGGSARGLVEHHKMLPERVIAPIMRQLVQGLSYLHAQHLIHRDLKAHNLMFNGRGELKLVEFGVARKLRDQAERANTFTGTPYWMAPEVIEQVGYDEKADVWSLGITAIELAKGDPPLASMHAMRALMRIPQDPPPQLSEDDGFSHEFCDFVNGCLQAKPADRPSTEELLKHPFINSAQAEDRTALLRALCDVRGPAFLEEDVEGVDDVAAAAPAEQEISSTLVRVVYPALAATMETLRTEGGDSNQQLQALAQLKRAFDAAESTCPDVANVFLSHAVEVLLRQQASG